MKEVITIDGATITVEHPEKKVVSRLVYEIRQAHAGANGRRKKLAEAEARVKTLEAIAKRAIGTCTCQSTMRPDIPCLSCAARAALKEKP